MSSYGNNAITEYKAGAKRNVKPIDTISGGNTELDSPTGMAFDSSGRLYVANTSGDAVVAFAKGASGNATPVVTISGSNTGLDASLRDCVRLERPFAGCR